MTMPTRLATLERTPASNEDARQSEGSEELSRMGMVGEVVRRRIDDEPRLKYFMYVPHNAGSNPPLLVSVHGISRNARQHAKCFAQLADKYGVVVVAPHFSKKQFAGYQRLGRSGQHRADLALQAIVADVRRLIGAKNKMYLFGYSGGAQFAHRYAMAYPEQIECVVVGAAGWYTFPDATRRFPFGTRITPRFPDIVFDADKYLQIPIRVIVGGWDIHRDEAINRRPKIDKQQGKTRLERARRWIFQMSQEAAARSIVPRHELIVLTHCGHNFADCVKDGKLAQHVFEFCFEATPSVAGTVKAAEPDPPLYRKTETNHGQQADAENIQ